MTTGEPCGKSPAHRGPLWTTVSANHRWNSPAQSGRWFADQGEQQHCTVPMIASFPIVSGDVCLRPPWHRRHSSLCAAAIMMASCARNRGISNPWRAFWIRSAEPHQPVDRHQDRSAKSRRQRASAACQELSRQPTFKQVDDALGPIAPHQGAIDTNPVARCPRRPPARNRAALTLSD
jgi:hypothetical protein